MNITHIRELLNEKEYPITPDSPVAKYAIELRNAIGPLLDRVDDLKLNSSMFEEQAKAWVAITNLLDEVSPEWTKLHSSGLQCATTAIRNLAALRGKGE